MAMFNSYVKLPEGTWPRNPLTVAWHPKLPFGDSRNHHLKSDVATVATSPRNMLVKLL